MSKFEDTILKEIGEVRMLIDNDSDAERATLEGWYEALSWVLVEFRKGI
jgi:hypothetical protein